MSFIARPGPARGPLVRVDFCCNDPDSGSFEGRVNQIQVGGETVLALEARRWSGLSLSGCPSLAFGQQEFRLAGKRWATCGRTSWYGNWCWDAVWMREQTARQFLVWLHGRGLFRCTSGFDPLFDAWHAPGPLPLEPDDPTPVGLGLSFLSAVLEEQARG